MNTSSRLTYKKFEKKKRLEKGLGKGFRLSREKYNDKRKSMAKEGE